MDLEKEAEDFMEGRQEQFYEVMSLTLVQLEMFLKDNLNATRELQIALEKLTEAEMWIAASVEQYGVKDFVPKKGAIH